MDMSTIYLNSLAYETALANTLNNSNLTNAAANPDNYQSPFDWTTSSICKESSENYRSQQVSPFGTHISIPLPNQMDDNGCQVFRRNERERLRVRWINEGYQQMRSMLPPQYVKTRMSKLETLNLAIAHIKHLKKLLDDSHHNNKCDCYKHCMK
ncbi:Myc-type, basic helix-loop-helix (bHLH) domain-containing protein [Strongyloides ratti]|uniref:Myc-type, basic helix-loop-helix (BHLH) domain-containing protein n=1 Tax=Strongyloides ratti TaxID=34506 RepID=A0A090KT17_STRRB|nr:Myc-type, basic helix-loop-helix (bHLH) domain-containing protein [Strongyloides ratti]CEF60551.1 Myc-type, basic helix-loop-helix (bHLH) domain-containing protein [Strongyloides ratti]